MCFAQGVKQLINWMGYRLCFSSLDAHWNHLGSSDHILKPGTQLREPGHSWFPPAPRWCQCIPRLGAVMSFCILSGSTVVSPFCWWLRICRNLKFQSIISSVAPFDTHSYPVLRQVRVGSNLLSLEVKELTTLKDSLTSEWFHQSCTA